ncbi:hypothetical protein GALMADRAFT_135781 [Galerina marginata CBS 339.88]|uniref:DNA polymerase delta subunit 3 n=1 Tax=Galerina marginata (strain CBS 339.88) TaxID=685588 RepID=A0A067TNV2_GALM3|nr:hypothetical protein GALMADRAFT_135781 [Galerina marginata CBS 339.88]
MTTQAISDYLTKQIFIEGNVVTFRSLSRHFSIHVNVAKNELATYHHNAPYQSQTSLATFLLSGTPTSNTRPQYKDEEDDDEDYNMDSTQASDKEEIDDGDEVPQIKITIVNERDLEDAKELYDEIYSIHVYSLSPAPLHDAGLICAPTELVRNTDKSKGPEYAVTVGRLVGKGIKAGTAKKRMQPPPPVAGPSKPKQPAVAEPKPVAKPDAKERHTATTDKVKPSGKIEFFKKADKAKETTKEVKKEAKEIKKEEPAEDKKRMFFSKPSNPVSKAPTKTASAILSKPASAAPSRPVSATSSKPASKASSPVPEIATTKDEKVQPKRGVKRKSSVGLEPRPKSPEDVASAVPKAGSNTRVRRKVVISDDESDAAPAKPVRRKSRLSIKTESTENSDAEREALAIMDIDDDEVEKVSRVPSTNASSNERDEDEDEDEDAESSFAKDEDVDMSDYTSLKPKTVKTRRKPKTVIPVGRNGLKKRKVTKTRKALDENGYMRKEDYSDWESVATDDEPEMPAPKTKKTKAKPAVVKNESEDEEMPPPPPTQPAKEKEKEKPTAAKKAPATKAKPAAKGGAKTQKGMMKNFFAPKKAAS